MPGPAHGLQRPPVSMPGWKRSGIRSPAKMFGPEEAEDAGASVLERSGLDWQLDAGLRLLQFSSQQAFNPSSPIKAHTSGTRKPKSLMCHARMPLLMTGPTLTFRRDRSRGSRGTQLQLPRAFRQPKSKQKCRSACQSLARSFGEPTFYCGWGVQIRIQRARPRPG